MGRCFLGFSRSINCHLKSQLENTMQVTRRSPFSGQINTKEINVTREQLDAWINGTLIQNAMPHLTPDEREFIMTGITKEEWDEAFSGEK